MQSSSCGHAMRSRSMTVCIKSYIHPNELTTMPVKKRFICFSFLIMFTLMVTVQLHWARVWSYSKTSDKLALPQRDSGLEGPLFSLAVNSTDTQIRQDSIHFPFDQFIRSDVLSAPWVTSLRTLLSRYRGKQVNIVSSDAKYQTVLLNWLISAFVVTDLSIETLLVISFDEDVKELLDSRDIPCVYVNHDTVIIKRENMFTKMSHIWITRSTVYRLMSSWGYDIAIYDTDAIILKNPQTVFDAYLNSDIIGSAGTYPFFLGKKWGATFCMGAALFRYTPKTELLWEALSSSMLSSQDDQVKINHALNDCGINWIKLADEIETKAVQGVCSANKLGGLKATILSRDIVCRHCHLKRQYYIWHNYSKKKNNSKVDTAKSLGLWFLKENWKEIGYSEHEEVQALKMAIETPAHILTMVANQDHILLKGVSWLKAISIID